MHGSSVLRSGNGSKGCSSQNVELFWEEGCGKKRLSCFDLARAWTDDREGTKLAKFAIVGSSKARSLVEIGRPRNDLFACQISHPLRAN